MPSSDPTGGGGPARPEPHHAAGRLASVAERLLVYAGLLAFAAVSLAWSVAGSLLYRILPRGAREAVGPRLVTAAARAYLGLLGLTGKARFDLAALDDLRAEGGLVIAPNHPSLLDAVMVVSRLPGVVCITKAGLWDNPLLGGGMRMAGYLRNDAPLRLTRQAAAKLREGRQLLLFPEGTRTARPTGVGPFRSGFALVAKLADVPVQTVFIEANSRFLGKDWPLLRVPELPLVYRVRLGARLRVEGDVQAFAAGLERYFEDELATAAGSAKAPRPGLA